MASTIKVKRSSTASAVPSSLAEGELAANTADGKLFLGKNDSSVVEIGAGGGGGGYTWLARYTPSSVSSIDITSITDSSTYWAYLIVFDLRGSQSGRNLIFRTSTNNGSSFDSGSNNYQYNMTILGQNSATYDDDYETFIKVGDPSSNSTTEGYSYGQIMIFRPDSTTSYTRIHGHVGVGADIDNQIITAVRRSTAAVNAFQLKYDFGDVADGEVNVYGLVKA